MFEHLKLNLFVALQFHFKTSCIHSLSQCTTIYKTTQARSIRVKSNTFPVQLPKSHPESIFVNNIFIKILPNPLFFLVSIALETCIGYFLLLVLFFLSSSLFFSLVLPYNWRGSSLPDQGWNWPSATAKAQSPKHWPIRELLTIYFLDDFIVSTLTTFRLSPPPVCVSYNSWLYFLHGYIYVSTYSLQRLFIIPKFLTKGTEFFILYYTFQKHWI